MMCMYNALNKINCGQLNGLCYECVQIIYSKNGYWIIVNCDNFISSILENIVIICWMWNKLN